MKYIYSSITLLLLWCQFACKKLVEVDPPRAEISKSKVFTSDATAEATLINVYGNLTNSGGFASGWTYGLSYNGGLLSDEYTYYGSGEGALQLYFNNLTTTSDRTRDIWVQCYNLIYTTNSTIEGLAASTAITPAVKDRLMGEAKFLRAFCHFYLASLFGDIPYVTTTDYQQNAKIARMPVKDVYTNIAADLEEAIDLLPNDYSTTERVRPNKWTASALQARTYLYNGEWAKAEGTATAIIDNAAMYTLLPLNSVFLKNSKETIWQLLPESGYKFVWEGYLNILLTTPEYVSLRQSLVDAFEPDDDRKSTWVGTLTVGTNPYYFPYKYKETSSNATGSEYSMVFRLAEQYLIRAEARANLDKLTGSNSAESDVNAIRNRAGLPNTTAATKDQLLDAIIQERRVELFTEWGHRWFDLKRTGRATAVLSPIKPGWNDTDVLFPIPKSEILLNINLTQNPGY